MVIGSASLSQISKSSQLGSGISDMKIHVKGGFEIDEDFNIDKCTFMFDQSASMQVNATLITKNSFFYACERMWRGINLGYYATIDMDNVHIEDAEVAISAGTHSFLTIINSIFNRNRIGVQLSKPSFISLQPVIKRFNGNDFTCDAPLNGTEDEISFAGVELSNVAFVGHFSYFNNLEYGIYSATNAIVFAEHNDFTGLKRDGIHISGLSSITLEHSDFLNCEEEGIHLPNALLTDIEHCSFEIDNDIPLSDDSRNGILIEGFALNSSVSIKDSDFTANIQETTNKFNGISLQGGSVGAGTTIRIFDDCQFLSITDRTSHGILLEGDFPIHSETDIFNNVFFVAYTTSLNGTQGFSVYSEGEINNFSLVNNYFGSIVNGRSFFIELRNSMGENNRIADNTTFGNKESTSVTGARFTNIFNTEVCNNDFESRAFGGPGFSFGGSNDINFTSNHIIYPTCISIGGSLNPQVHKGNQWNYFCDSDGCFSPTWGARLGNHNFTNNDNLFVVHTEQSVVINYVLLFFSPYYHYRIFPEEGDPEYDPDYPFFETQLNGTPESCGTQELQNEYNNAYYRSIADNSMSTSQENLAALWTLRNNLYQKIERSPDSDLANNFNDFVKKEEHNSIGKFYAIKKGIDAAWIPSSEVDQQNKYYLTLIESALEQTESQNSIEDATNQLSVALNNLSKLQENYLLEVSENLKPLITENSAISISETVEENQKIYNDIYLKKWANQQGILTEGQLEQLRRLALQCPEVGGLAVSKSRGLLPDCIEDELAIQYECFQEEVEEFDLTPIIEQNGLNLQSDNKTIKTQKWLYPNPASV